MYKVKHVAITIFITIGACSFALALGTSASQHLKDVLKDSIDINNKSEPVPPIIQVNNVSSIPPQPLPTSTVTPDPHNITTSAPTTSSSTTPAPTTSSTTPASTTSSTTPASTTLPTTKPPTPNVTTTAPNVTTVAPNSTTPVPVTTVKPTASPITPVPAHRRFDGPSFIGGIVLALGLVAIGFVAFKFYKARTELNYHTL